MGSFGQGDPYLMWRANATTSPSPLPCSCFKGQDAWCWAWLCGEPVAISLRNETPGLALMSSSVLAVLLCFCRLRTGNFGIAEECLQQAHSFSLTCCTAQHPSLSSSQHGTGTQHLRQDPEQCCRPIQSGKGEQLRLWLAGNACLGNTGSVAWERAGLPPLLNKENCEVVERSLEILHNYL